jgi:hypothetical protein
MVFAEAVREETEAAGFSAVGAAVTALEEAALEVEEEETFSRAAADRPAGEGRVTVGDRWKSTERSPRGKRKECHELDG